MYGIGAVEILALLASQGGACAGCRKPLAWPHKRTHVDHDHATGKVRGILCDRCNTKVDKHSTPEILHRLAEYLRPR